MPGVRGPADGKLPRFVKTFADVRGQLLSGAQAYAAEVKSGSFPGPEHTF